MSQGQANPALKGLGNSLFKSVGYKVIGFVEIKMKWSSFLFGRVKATKTC